MQDRYTQTRNDERIKIDSILGIILKHIYIYTRLTKIEIKHKEIII